MALTRAAAASMQLANRRAASDHLPRKSAAVVGRRAAGRSTVRAQAYSHNAYALSAPFPRDLFLGCTGDDVRLLQVYLVDAGYLHDAGVTGYVNVFVLPSHARADTHTHTHEPLH